MLILARRLYRTRRLDRRYFLCTLLTGFSRIVGRALSPTFGQNGQTARYYPCRGGICSSSGRQKIEEINHEYTFTQHALLAQKRPCRHPVAKVAARQSARPPRASARQHRQAKLPTILSTAPIDAPLVVLFHGLEGGGESHYAVELVACATARLERRGRPFSQLRRRVKHRARVLPPRRYD